MGFEFKPSQDTNRLLPAPFFEDARADTAPNYATKKTPDVAKAEVIAELAKLGGIAVYFTEGAFEDGKLKRWGYEVRFTLDGRPGMFRVAGLSMRNPTPEKKQRVLAQALLTVRDWVIAMVTMKVFMPGTEPLIQFLLVDGAGGSQTVTDYIVTVGKLPQMPIALPALTPKIDVVDGVVVG